MSHSRASAGYFAIFRSTVITAMVNHQSSFLCLYVYDVSTLHASINHYTSFNGGLPLYPRGQAASTGFFLLVWEACLGSSLGSPIFVSKFEELSFIFTVTVIVHAFKVRNAGEKIFLKIPATCAAWCSVLITDYPDRLKRTRVFGHRE